MSCEADAVKLLREMGYKLTPQRLMVLSVLRHHPGHLTAGEIFEEVKSSYPYVDISTVYRTMAMLKELRLVNETDLGVGDTTFEWANVSATTTSSAAPAALWLAWTTRTWPGSGRNYSGRTGSALTSIILLSSVTVVTAFRRKTTKMPIRPIGSRPDRGKCSPGPTCDDGGVARVAHRDQAGLR